MLLRTAIHGQLREYTTTTIFEILKYELLGILGKILGYVHVIFGEYEIKSFVIKAGRTAT